MEKEKTTHWEKESGVWTMDHPRTQRHGHCWRCRKLTNGVVLVSRPVLCQKRRFLARGGSSQFPFLVALLIPSKMTGDCPLGRKRDELGMESGVVLSNYECTRTVWTTVTKWQTVDLHSTRHTTTSKDSRAWDARKDRVEPVAWAVENTLWHILLLSIFLSLSFLFRVTFMHCNTEAPTENGASDVQTGQAPISLVDALAAPAVFLEDSFYLEFWLGSPARVLKRGITLNLWHCSKERPPVSVRVQVRNRTLNGVLRWWRSVGCTEINEKSWKETKEVALLILFGFDREIIGRQRDFSHREKGRFGFFCLILSFVPITTYGVTAFLVKKIFSIATL